jgi:hypothetical protein
MLSVEDGKIIIDVIPIEVKMILCIVNLEV